MLNKATLAALAAAKTQDVHVPEWGDTVRLKELNGAEREAFTAWVIKARKKDGDAGMVGAEARLLALTLVGEDGKAVFEDVEEGIKILNTKSGRVIQKLAKVSMQLSGLDPESVEAAEEVFPKAPSGSSGSV